LDTRPEQLDDQLVALEFLDRAGQHLVQRAGEGGQLRTHRGGERGHPGDRGLVQRVSSHPSASSRSDCAPGRISCQLASTNGAPRFVSAAQCPAGRGFLASMTTRSEETVTNLDY